MNNDGISGINIGQTKLDNYEGNTKDANLNAKGSFSGRNVRKFNNNVGSYLTGSHDLQTQQDRAQKKLNSRRIAVLTTQGDASKAASEASHSAVTTNKGGQLKVASCPDLDNSLQEFKKLASDPMASGKVGQFGWDEKVSEQGETTVTPSGTGSSRKIVDPEKFKQRVQKDLTVFLGNTIKGTDTPHGLERLRQTVEHQFDDGQISKSQKTHLNKLIGKQYQLQLKNFPAYLAGLQAKDDSDEARHTLAKEKLAAIHEITIAAQEHDPGIVKKHHQMLKAAALDCYEQCGRSTSPRATNLFEAQEWVQRLEQEASDWLAPVLELTSKHPSQRLEQAAKSVAAQVDPLKLQLDEIPALERSMSKTAAEAVKLMQDMAKLESVIGQKQKQLGREILELKQMREDAGRFRRMNLAYQYRRRNNLQRQEALRETITDSTSKETTNIDQFNNFKKTYNGEFQAQNELREKYGSSVEVLPKAPAPSTSSLGWKTEVSKLDGHDLATEFDKACINHHLDSLASKFPGHDIEEGESFGTKYVTDTAREYVRAVKDRRELPAIALRTALGEGRISSVLQVQKTLDTSGFDDIAQSSEEQLIPALRPKNTSPVNGQPEPQTKEALEDATPLGDAPIPVATLDSSDFSELLKQKLDGSQNPDVTPDNIELITSQLEQMLTQEKLPEDGLEALADFFEYCASTPDSSEPPNYWHLAELIPGLQAGIDTLKSGKSSDEAVDEMGRVLLARTETPQSSKTDETDSLLGDSASIQVSAYIDSLFENFSPVSTGAITLEDQNALLQQLATAHEDSDIEESDLDMVAFHLHKTLRQAPESSQAADFGRLSDALTLALGELINQQPLAVATRTMNEKLSESPKPKLT